MRFYIVRVGALTYRDLQACSIDAITHALDRFPNARRVSARLAQ